MIEFRVISNNNPTEQTLIWLVNAKVIFSKQLPKMPKEYIARMVFDRQHRNLILLRNGQCIGGICFRPFPQQLFVEIVFLAISSTEQVKVPHCCVIGCLWWLSWGVSTLLACGVSLLSCPCSDCLLFVCVC